MDSTHAVAQVEDVFGPAWDWTTSWEGDLLRIDGHNGHQTTRVTVNAHELTQFWFAPRQAAQRALRALSRDKQQQEGTR